MGTTKVCSAKNGCGQEKDITEFPKKRNTYRNVCKACHNNNNRLWRSKNPEKARESKKKYCQRNPEKVKQINKISTRKHSQKYPEKVMLASSIDRAAKNNLEHNITLEDIVIPEYCPVLGIKLENNRGKGYKNGQPNSPSLDRIDNSKGYVKGNVRVISWRANHLKGDASYEELEKIFLSVNKNTQENKMMSSETPGGFWRTMLEDTQITNPIVQTTVFAPELKTCKKCNVAKELKEYAYHNLETKKLKSVCRKCTSLYDKENFLKKKLQKEFSNVIEQSPLLIQQAPQTIKNHKCANCKQIKLITEFSVNRTRKSGVQSWCKECHAKERREKLYKEDKNHPQMNFDGLPLFSQQPQTTKNSLCVKCKQTKLITEFSMDNNRKSGVQAWCKACHAVERKRLSELKSNNPPSENHNILKEIQGLISETAQNLQRFSDMLNLYTAANNKQTS